VACAADAAARLLLKALAPATQAANRRCAIEANPRATGKNPRRRKAAANAVRVVPAAPAA
jgi:hypothetical protein